MQKRKLFSSSTSNSNQGNSKRYSFLDWLFNSNSTDTKEMNISYHSKLQLSESDPLNKSTKANIISPDHKSAQKTKQNKFTLTMPQRYSRSCTPIYENDPREHASTDQHYDKRRSYRNDPRLSSINTKEASIESPWKPLTRLPSPPWIETDIPTRRTSKNYNSNPEIEAKMNVLLNSDRASYLSHILQQRQQL
jgi:hypothetical protein